MGVGTFGQSRPFPRGHLWVAQLRLNVWVEIVVGDGVPQRREIAGSRLNHPNQRGLSVKIN